MFVLLYLMSIFFVDISSLDSNKWFQNQDNCTVTVAGLCKPIDPQLRQSCLGTPLPYEFTSDGPIIGDAAHFDLQIWAALKAVPMCWDKLQTFLCTIYVPECRRLESPSSASSSSVASMASMGSQKADDLEYSQVVLPERGMCQAVRKACPLLFSGNGIGGRSLLGDVVPKFLQCEVYAPVCRQNKLRPKLSDVNKATCQAPLVSTPNNRNWIKGVAACAFPCRSPVYRPEHYILARSLTFGAAIAGILVNVCVLCSLRLLRPQAAKSTTSPSSSPANRKTTTGAAEEGSGSLLIAMTTATPCRRLPHTALTFIHMSFLVGCFGFLMPHLPGVGDSIACRADGSVRVGEPQTQASSPFLCVICFMLIYVPLLTVALWSNVLDYALFSAFHYPTTRIVASSAPSPSVFHLRRLGTAGDVTSVGERLRRLQRGGGGNGKHPGLLLSHNSCDSSKMRLGSSGINEAMERSMSPASPATAVAKKRFVSMDMREKVNNDASWKLGGNGDPTDNHSLPLVCRLLYSNDNSAVANDSQTIEGQRTTFNSMGSQITCIRVAAFAVPIVFALISVTASEIDGEPLSGLCLVGIRTLWAYCSMVIAPLVLCLLLKVIYLSRAMKSMRRLSCYLATSSYSPVDREMAHRLSVCFRAYVVYILTLVALLTFSVGVHAYAYMEEPKWLETQRLFLFCQLRHRLMGLDGTAAAAACRTPFTAGISLFSEPSHASNLTEVRVRRDIHPPLEDGPEIDNSSSGRPLIGPLLLNLFTFFMLNLVFASMCLLDSTVKRKWFGFIQRVVFAFTSCPSKLTQPKPTQTTIPSTSGVFVGSKSSDSATGTTFHLPGAFSWWDPGMFFHDFYEIFSPTNPPLDSRKPNNIENSLISAANRGAATSEVSCGCNRRYSSSTNEESWVLSSIGATNATSTIHGGGVFGVGNASSSVVSSNATGIVVGPTVTAGGQFVKPMHKSNSLNSSQSLFITHQRGSGGGHQKSKSSANGAVLFNSSAFRKQEEANLMAAGALERNLARPIRRSRHRRMWSGKTSGRRRLISRSYSTLGLAGAGNEERRSLNSLLFLHRAASSSNASTSNTGKQQQNLSIESLSRLYAAAAAMELERSRKNGSGSRRGTASRLSLASSSGAESYNSFQLLAEQAGATWRELWRTRMLLIDALHWAQSAAAAAAENPLQHLQIPPQPTDQQQLIAATSVMMAYLMGQHQQQQNAQTIQPQEPCCPIPITTGSSAGGEGTPDSVMMAALMAATAAAQAAMQHQQHQFQNPELGVPISAIPTMPMAPLRQLPQISNLPPKGDCQLDRVNNCLPLSSLTKTASTTPGASFRGTRHDVVCHLDASTNAGIVSPLHPSRRQQHQSQSTSPWCFQNVQPLQPSSVWSGSASTDLSQFAMSLGAPPYAFVPPPTAHMISQSQQPLPPNITNPAAELEEDDEGSDAFDSEDEVMSTSGDETADVRAQRRRSHRPITTDVISSNVDPKVQTEQYWEEEDPFPTPEGQPSCIILPSDDSIEAILDPDADDISSVSQSASQIVVATVHEKDKSEMKRS